MEVAQGGMVADKRKQQAAAGHRGHLIVQKTQKYSADNMNTYGP